ncbi:aryl hydrocarbon receptor-like isoform X1 [Mastacembelus armatus]|uniref:Aryl hydrocarbon receptor n=1 Tax=Mastacembelus armatus TaxID=205130 RepID=A0A7N9AM24_9TELE|nr:aryl hydrocarbon receptor-like isoform X1 [Mastacembelus armatus]
MLGNPGTYANKKRKKPVLKPKKVLEGNEVVKSNPSKRHRDRLNGELDQLTDLLPFPEDIRSRLDKLSVLRLSVGYLRVKSYFKDSPSCFSNLCAATMKSSHSSLMFPGVNGQNGNNMDTAGFSEGDFLLQALNGFVMVITSEGLMFYASQTIKDYLGFHQSDVIHQSAFELIHTDDRDMFRQQLHFALNPSPVGSGVDGLQSCVNTVMYSPEQLPPENSSFLERSFVCRFRCLLDNSSGFLALKFHGRLKYLHGQSVLRENGTCNKPQLALFSIAMPVQPPSIVEIRAKMLLFQTKHKLDFTPTGIDSRGKIVLGYSETELCMKGSGYQFIHAADMMYCADNHIRMIKTGESGLTVFRLLSKSGSWVWVKANAKLIFKGGRPEYIIAYQKALVNDEGEDYLRQRRLQLPFSFTTGEAVLYNTGPTVDITQFQFNKMFSNNDMSKDVAPGSLLDCFLRQDKKAYTHTVDRPLPVDQVFMDSRALVNIPSDAWQENGETATTGGPVVVKEEAKQSVMSVIDSLEKMAQNGELGAALQNLEMGEAELMEWENALKRFSQDECDQKVTSDLDTILTNDIFDYIDTVLFKEKGEDCLNLSPPSCLSSVSNTQQDLFTQAAQLSATELNQPQLLQTPCSDHTNPPVNGLYAYQQAAVNVPVATGQSLVEPAQIFNGTQKLSHQTPLIASTDTSLPPLQHLQLQDIVSPAIGLSVPDTSADGAFSSFQSCRQVSLSHMGSPQGISGLTEPSQFLSCPQNNLQAPAMAANGQLLQTTVKQPNNVASSIMDILPPLIPCNEFSSSSRNNVPISFPTTCLQGNHQFETHNHQFQQWSQSQQQKLHHTGIMQNGHDAMPACHRQTSESQTFPHTGLWPNSVTGLNHTQQGVACGQAVTHSSCMFDQHFSSSPAGGDFLALSGPSGLRGADTSLDPSLPQGSCYMQWNGSDAVQDERLSTELNGIFAPSPCDVAMYLAE